jgi:hypothetical protein
VSARSSLFGLAVIATSLAALSCRHAVSDSAGVPESLVRTYPCPNSVPSAWTVVDPSLGHGPRCSLVQAAAHELRSAGAIDSVLARVDPAGIACVRVYRWRFRDARTDSVSSDYWTVEFYSDQQPDVVVRVDPVTGATRAAAGNREFGASTRQLCAAAV